MKISIIGLGYVGLANATLLNDYVTLTCFDINPFKGELIKKGISPFKDDDISSYLTNHHLDVSFSFKEACYLSDYIIICTNTNYDEELKSFDISSIESVIEKALMVKNDVTFVIRSTIPVGCVDYLIKKFKTENIIFMPEFLKEGTALKDNLNPNRIVYGFDTDNNSLYKKVLQLDEIYKKAIVNKEVQTLFIKSKEAESIKLFSNSYLAMRVAFFNELDSFCLKENINSKNVIDGVCLDSRIGNFYNNPSFGYGGYCLPKDTKELKALFQEVPNELIDAIVSSNETRKEFIAEDIIKCAKNINSNPIIGIYRLVMKKNSDNYRDSSVLGVISNIKKTSKDIKIIIYEPLIKENSYLECEIINDLDTFLQSIDLLVSNRKEKLDFNKTIYCRDVFNYD